MSDRLKTKWVVMLGCPMVVAVTAGMLCSPIPGISQRRRNRESQRRQQTKNQWRNIGVGSAVVGLLGLVKGKAP